jgi:hypothetical protein
MKLPRNIALTIGSIVLLVLIAASGFLLFRGVSSLNAIAAALAKSRDKLNGIYELTPFPSRGNVAKVRENVAKLEVLFRELIEVVSQNQVEPSGTSPSTFMSDLANRRNQLQAQAALAGTTLPKDLGFGFETYFAAGSLLPAADDVPRLAQQLIIVEKLVAVLFEEKVGELASVEREEFEVRAGAAGPSPGRSRSRRLPTGASPAASKQSQPAGLMETNSLYAKLHFTIEFKAREKTLTAVLNRLAKHEMFIVVTGVEVTKSAPDVKEVAVEAAAEDAAEPAATETKIAKPAKLLKRQERIVAGLPVEALSKVVLDLDVYRFAHVK